MCRINRSFGTNMSSKRDMEIRKTIEDDTKKKAGRFSSTKNKNRYSNCKDL